MFSIEVHRIGCAISAQDIWWTKCCEFSASVRFIVVVLTGIVLRDGCEIKFLLN